MREKIDIDKLKLQVNNIWKDQGFLLAAGENDKSPTEAVGRSGKFNVMTIGWGSIGYMWRKPFIQVVVRPGRYTYQFMEEFSTFTVSAFPEEYRSALALCGSKSGRDFDKIAKTNLSPINSQMVAAPSFAQAELVFECRKIYHHDFSPQNFGADYIAPLYDGTDYHRSYFGEILAVYGSKKYVN